MRGLLRSASFFQSSGGPGGLSPCFALSIATCWSQVPIIERPQGLLLRVSTHFYNDHAEIDRLADALPGLVLEP